MTTQIKRSMLFLVGNLAISAICIAVFASRIAQDQSWFPDNRIWWARAILLYVITQIVFRVLAMIGLAIHNAATGETEEVDRVDELDKLIDLRSTSLTSGVFMAFFLVALATQGCGLSLRWLFAVLAAGMIVSGLLGDASNLARYRRGY